MISTFCVAFSKSWSGEFDSESLRIFYQVTILGETPADVAEQYAWTVGRVYKIKYRIMKRLRESGRMFLE